MNLRVSKESSSGLNTEFVNTESGRHFSLEHVITQIENGNSSYKGYQTVSLPNGTKYVRSVADGNSKNNIE